MKSSAPVKHLLVDLDGTLLGNRGLVLSADFITQAVKFLLKYGGLRQAFSVLSAIQKELKQHSFEFTNEIRVVDLFSKKLNVAHEEGQKILSEAVHFIFPKLEKYFYPIDGAKEFLDWAKDRYTLTLATNPVWPVEIIELRVRWAGLDPAIFQGITHVRQMHSCKPSLEYYREILTQLNFKAEDCLLIGNDLKMDVPATQVGIRTFIVGPHKKQIPIKQAGSKALAWRGSYRHLREYLEQIPPQELR